MAPRIVAFLLLTLAALPVAAQPRETEVYVQPGVATQAFTGRVGRFSSGSVGLHVTQGVNAGRFGGYLTIGADFYLTSQPPPPYTRGLQTFLVGVGFRYGIPFERVRLFVGAEYSSVGVTSNALNRFLGDSLHYNALGGHVATRVEIARPLYAELTGTSRFYVDTRDFTMGYGLVMSIGVAGRL